MTTHAVHLEIAGDLSRDSSILLLRSFIACCGNVKNIHQTIEQTYRHKKDRLRIKKRL